MKLQQLKLLLFIFTFVLLSPTIFAQTYSIPIGSPTEDEGGASIIKHTSGDYFIGGFRNDSSMVMRTSPNGNVIWAKTYNFGTGVDYITSIRFADNGDIIGTGCSTTGTVSNHYAFAFRLDVNGNPIWQQFLKYPNELTIAFDIREMYDGNLLCGMAMHQTTNHTLAAMVKLEQNTGTIIWDTTYYGNTLSTGWDEDWGRMAIEPNTKDIYTAGRFQTGNGQGTYRPIITKFDSTGAYQWSRITQYAPGIYGGRMYGSDIEIDGDSMVMLLMGKNGSTSSAFDIGIQKMDLDGFPAWNRFYTSATGLSLRTYNVFNVPNGYVITGYYLTGNQNMYMVHLNNVGDIVWAKSYGTSGTEKNDYFSSNNNAFLDGSNLVLTAWSNGFNVSQDIFLIKVDLATGDLTTTGCSEDLLLNEIPLPNYSENYPLNSQANLMTQTTVPINSGSINFSSGHLVEAITDTIVSNDTLTFCTPNTVDVIADWNTNYDYLWSTGATTQQITLNQTGTYWVDVSGGGCYLFSDTVHVVVNSIPPVDLGPDLVLCNSTNPISWDFTSYSGSFLWQDASTNSTFSTNNSGTYWVEITDNGCSVSDTVNLSYISTTPPDLGPDTVFCTSINFVLTANGTSGNYLWQNGSTQQNYQVNTSGTFWVHVDTMGCIESDTIQVTFSAPPTPDLGPDTILCDPLSVITLDVFESGATYLWQDGSTNSNFTVSSSGTYWVESTVNGCSSSDSVTITYNAPPNLSLGNDTTLCAPSQFTLSPGPFDTYLWSNNSTADSLNIASSGLYHLTVSLNGCFTSDSINVSTVQPPIVDLGPDTILCDPLSIITLDAFESGATYLWQDGSTNSNFTVSSSGTYWVESTVNGCSSSDSVTITYNAPPNLSLGNDTTLCAPSQFTLSPGPFDTYLWSNNSTADSLNIASSGLYHLTVSLNGCFTSDSINVSTVQPPIVDLGPDTSLCDINPNINLDATTAGVSYEWQDGSTNATYNVTSSGQYYVTVYNGFCSASDTINIAFFQFPDVDLGADTTYCNDVQAVLDASCSGCTYQWQDGSTSPSLDISQSGTYQVQVNLSGCIAYDTIVISQNNIPDISVQNIALCELEEKLISLNEQDAWYVWQNGSTSNEFLINTEGDYQVIVTNDCGSDTATFSVAEINCFCEVYIPNTFTPNGDEYNGIFEAKTDCPLELFEFEVYNRWGELIFSTQDINIGWDGTYNGRQVQDGTYTWKIKYRFAEYAPAENTGHVNVIR